MEVKNALKLILEYTKKIHDYYQDLPYGDGGREADQHGFVAGILNNFRYRENAHVYLEQFAGKGYADIVILVRGPDRSPKSIPIIIELKAGTGSGTGSDDALNQVEEYTKGFQPNNMRILSLADNILCVGMNLDSPSSFFMQMKVVERDQAVIPVVQQIINQLVTEEIINQNPAPDDLIVIQQTIKQYLEKTYNTFPGTGEKSSAHYMSRFLLGESLVLRDYDKHIFIYDKESYIPTATVIDDHGTRSKKPKIEKIVDGSNAVNSILLISKDKDNPAIILNIIDTNRALEPKKLPLNVDIIGNRKIISLDIKFNIDQSSQEFNQYCDVELGTIYNSISEYRDVHSPRAQGSFTKIGFKDSIDLTFVLKNAIDSQNGLVISEDKYKEFFRKVAAILYPIKSLIGRESEFQGLLEGIFKYYSDVSLSEGAERRALVLTEFQTGSGSRIDMLVQAIGSLEHGMKEYIPVGLELKYDNSIKLNTFEHKQDEQIQHKLLEIKAHKLLEKLLHDQTEQYAQGAAIKSITDGSKVAVMGIVFNGQAKDPDKLLLTTDQFLKASIVHSSLLYSMSDSIMVPNINDLPLPDSAYFQPDWVEQETYDTLAKMQGEDQNLLSLFNKNLDDKKIMQLHSLLKNNPNLQSIDGLDLSFNRFTATSLKRLIDILGTKLIYLDLTDNDLAQDNFTDLEEVIKDLKVPILRIADIGMNNLQMKRIIELLAVQDKVSDLEIQHLESLKMTSNLADSISTYLQDSQMLECLDLSKTGIDNKSIIKISQGLKHSLLKTLVLRDNDISQIGVEALATALARSAISHIPLSGNPLGVYGVDALVKSVYNNSKIKLLELINVDLKYIPDQGDLDKRKKAIKSNEKLLSIMESLFSNPNLYNIDISYNDIGNGGIQRIFSTLINHIETSNLKSLSLAGNQIDLGAHNLVITVIAELIYDYISQTRILHSLDLSLMELYDEVAVKIVSALEKNLSLIHLDLSGNDRIDTKTISALARVLSTNKYLEYLNLADNKLNINDLSILLDGLKKNSELTHLNLSGNDFSGIITESNGRKITNLGNQDIKNLLKNNNSLKYLNLAKCQLNTELLKSLFAALKENNSLEVLDIRDHIIDNEIVDYVVEALRINAQQGLNGLKILHISKTKLDHVAISKLTDKSLGVSVLVEDAIASEVELSEELQQTRTVDLLSSQNLALTNEFNEPQQIFERATRLGDYHYWLQQHDIPDIARVHYGYKQGEIEIVGSIDQLSHEIKHYRNSDYIGPFTIILNIGQDGHGGSHWVSIVLNRVNNQHHAYYTDSLGNHIASNIITILNQNRILVHDISITQQRDGHNCGLFALDNGHRISQLLLGNSNANIYDIRNNLVPSYNDHELQVLRRNIASELENDVIHQGNLINIGMLPLTNNKEKPVNIDLSGNEISPSARSKLNTYQLKYSLGVLDDNDDDISIIQACLPSTSRHKREIHECKIGWDDVDKISNGQTRNSDELVIDSKKFLEYSKQHTEDGIKSLQLVRLAEEVKSKGDGKIVGKYQGLLEQVIQDKGYKNYLQQKRIDAIGHYVIDRDSYSISPELKLKLINAAGKIQLIRGMHGLVVSCQEGAGSDCALSVSGLGYSFLSQPIENMMVKAAPRIINNAAHVSSHIAPRILSYDTKFMVRVFGGKYATKLAKGGAGVIASIFDIVDIGISANALIECNKRADSNNVCSDKEIRDNIASISFASIAFVSSVTLTAMGAGPAAVVVGFVIMVGQGIYTGISTIIEYEEKYNTTLSENMEIFFHSFFFMSPPRHVEHLAARTRYVNDTVLYAWEELTNLPDNIVAYAIGLGEVEFRNIQPYREMILAVPVFCPRGIKNCSPDIIYEQHKVYNPGTIVAPTFKPAYAMIDMSREDTLHIRAEFSRVLPTPIQNSNMICLPKISEQEYELHKQNHLAWNVLACLNVPFCMEITYNVNVMILKNDQKQYVPISKYDCNNAVVLEHALRMNLDFKNKSIVYNLQNVNAGTIFGSHKLNNIFLVFEGNTQIFGGTGSNELIIFRDKYNGSIYLNSSTNAIIDVSKLSSNVINMKYYDQYMIITTDQGIFRINELENTEIKYVGRPNKVDKIVCNQLFKLKGQNIDDDKEIKQNNIIIDSGGGINRARKDTIQDCNKLIVSPNTEVTASDYGNYYFYIKSNDYIKYYTEQQAASWIDILGRATIIFSEISLLEDDTKIKYDTINNNLVIKIPLAQNGWYKLLLSNYLQNDHSTNYVLINKYGSNIIPRLDKLKANDDVKYFTIYADIGRRVQQAEIFNYYKKITYTKHNYNIFTILKNENNELLKFGSAGADIIINDDNTILMSGREGADVYVITQMKYLELYISNESQDLELDILKMPLELPGIPIIRHDSDLVLGIILGMKVIILDYFASKEYQHIALMDVDNNLYIPLELGEEIRLVPFCHKSFSKNVFILTSNVGHAVIDIDEDNIVLYKQGSDLLITEKESRFNSSNSLNIILKEYYYQDKQQWLDTKLYRYNNATSIIIDLHKMKISEISYQEYYDSIIKEYIVDLSKGFKYICYNLTDQLMPVEPSEERIGIVIFENTPLKRLVVSEIGPYYTFKDKLYDNLLIIGPWRNNPKYQISFFEFDNGLELERINVSNKTIDRIKLNNAIDRKIGKIDNNIVKAVIDYLKLSCSKYNEQNILSEKLRYNFLEEELNYRVGDSNNQNSNLEEVRKYLNSANNISGEAFMWLVVKSYNELLLKYPDIEQKSLHKIDDSCFGTVLSSSIIKKMIEYLNASASFYDIKQYLNDNKQDVQKISELLSTSDLNNHHKHRHHHGENYHREAHHNKNITAHHRGRRDIEDRLSKISEESNSDDMRVFVSDDNIVLSSSSSLKPLGYNIVNWLRDKLNSLNLNPITQVKNWFNVDDAKEQARIDWDFVDNLSYQDNNLCELNADYANGRKLLGLGYKVEQSSSRLIGDEESSIINGINYNLLDKQGNLLLLDLLLRKQTGIKYNNKGAMLVSNNDEYAKYAHSLAYSSYASVEEHQEELELLGVN